jgi:exosortase/archaeosortase family protein
MFVKLSSFLDKNKLWPVIDVLLFIVITYLFHKLWWKYSHYIYSMPVFLNAADWLSRMVYLASAWIDAHLLGMDITLYFKNIIHFNFNNRGIEINESCSGFKQMYQVFILFLLFPGPFKHKLWYIPMGMLSMFLTNIVRVVLLSVTMIYWPQHWDFIHLWVLRPFYYVVIFVLWVVWIEHFGGFRRYFDAKKVESK